MKINLQIIILSWIISISASSLLQAPRPIENPAFSPNKNTDTIIYPGHRKEMKNIMNSLSKKYDRILRNVSKQPKVERKAIMALPASSQVLVKAVDLVNKNEAKQDDNGSQSEGEDPISNFRKFDQLKGSSAIVSENEEESQSEQSVNEDQTNVEQQEVVNSTDEPLDDRVSDNDINDGDNNHNDKGSDINNWCFNMKNLRPSKFLLLTCLLLASMASRAELLVITHHLLKLFSLY